jgi:ParB-like chromosome segregation protein Spo0J
MARKQKTQPTDNVESQQYVIVPIDDIAPHPKNARIGSVQVIAESIRRNGFYGACVVQRATNRIIAGSHRWKAAKAIGLTSVPVIFVDVSDEQAVRIMLADNRTSEIGTFDSAALLESLRSVGDLTGTGYDTQFLDELTTSLETITVGEHARTRTTVETDGSTFEHECPKCQHRW